MKLAQKKKAKRYSIIRSKNELKKIMPELPKNEIYKFVSCGNFSSISFILYLCDRTKINNLYASSLRIGRKHLQIIDAKRKEGKIDMCYFAVGSLMKDCGNTVKKYRYYDDFEKVCENNGWKYSTVNNHSKLLLFDTDLGKFVLETSSNLNENPKIEQFSFEKDDELFDFYKSVFERWLDG